MDFLASVFLIVKVPGHELILLNVQTLEIGLALIPLLNSPIQ